LRELSLSSFVGFRQPLGERIELSPRRGAVVFRQLAQRDPKAAQLTALIAEILDAELFELFGRRGARERLGASRRKIARQAQIIVERWVVREDHRCGHERKRTKTAAVQ